MNNIYNYLVNATSQILIRSTCSIHMRAKYLIWEKTKDRNLVGKNLVIYENCHSSMTNF